MVSVVLAALTAAGTARATIDAEVLDVGPTTGTAVLGLGTGQATGEWSLQVPDAEDVPRALRLRYVAGTGYARPAGLALPSTVQWVLLPAPTDEVGSQLWGVLDRMVLVSDPEALLTGVGPWTLDGPGTPDDLRGTPTVHYLLTAPTDPSSSADPAVRRDLARLRSAGVTGLGVALWVDADGRPVRLATTSQGASGLRASATFAGWGARADLAVPPAGAVLPLASLLGG